MLRPGHRPLPRLEDFSRSTFVTAARNHSTDDGAAAAAGVSRLTFRLRCRQYGIQTPEEREAQALQLLSQPAVERQRLRAKRR